MFLNIYTFTNTFKGEKVTANFNPIDLMQKIQFPFDL